MAEIVAAAYVFAMESTIGVFGVTGKARAAEAGFEITHWPFEKYARGVAHLDAARSLMRSWNLAGNAWIDWKLDDAGTTLDGFIRLESAPPTDDVALLLGDAVHCFRSSLDALVWQLCWLERPPAEGQRKRIYFPFVSTEAEWKKIEKGPLATMPSEFRERIAAFQPIGDDAPGNLLDWLFSLNNQDKHRSAIGAVPAGGGWTTPFSRVGDVGHPEAPVQGFTSTVHEPIEIVEGFHLVTTIFGIQIELARPSSPLYLDYIVENDRGETAKTGDLLVSLPALAGVLEFITTGLVPPEAPASGQAEASPVPES